MIFCVEVGGPLSLTEVAFVSMGGSAYWGMGNFLVTATTEEKASLSSSKH